MVAGSTGQDTSPEALTERLSLYLKLRGLSLTKERRQILETICEMDRRFNVDDLFFEVHSAGRKTSKATIYRTVQLLLECRILKETGLSDRQADYELGKVGDFRGHLVCQHCGKIQPIMGPKLSRFVRESSEAQGFLTLGIQLKFVGICNDCVRENPKSLRKDVCVPFLKYAQSRKSSVE